MPFPYRKAICHTLYTGERAADRYPCEIQLRPGRISVRYKISGEQTVYQGRDKGEGHYVLESDEPSGRATLHRIPDSQVLEGYWEEGGGTGMWRIELGSLADTVTGETEADNDDDDANAVVDSYAVDADEDEDVDEEVEEEDDGDDPPMRTYKFPLREDLTVALTLPLDLTRREGRRLGRFMRSLSYEE